MSLMSHSIQGSVLPNYIALIICNYGGKDWSVVVPQGEIPNKRDVILGHAPNEGLLHSDPPACIMELCQVTAICVITQLFDFFIACLTDTVAPVVVVGCQQNSH